MSWNAPGFSRPPPPPPPPHVATAMMTPAAASMTQLHHHPHPHPHSHLHPPPPHHHPPHPRPPPPGTMAVVAAVAGAGAAAGGGLGGGGGGPPVAVPGLANDGTFMARFRQRNNANADANGDSQPPLPSDGLDASTGAPPLPADGAAPPLPPLPADANGEAPPLPPLPAETDVHSLSMPPTPDTSATAATARGAAPTSSSETSSTATEAMAAARARAARRKQLLAGQRKRQVSAMQRKAAATKRKSPGGSASSSKGSRALESSSKTVLSAAAKSALVERAERSLDQDTLDAIAKVVDFIVKNGAAVEADIAKSRREGLAFVWDKESDAHLVYLEQLRKARKVASVVSGELIAPGPPIARPGLLAQPTAQLQYHPQPSLPAATVSSAVAPPQPVTKRSRRNRWGPPANAAAAVSGPVAPAVSTGTGQTSGAPVPAATSAMGAGSVASNGAKITAAGKSDTESDTQARMDKDQAEIRFLEQRLHGLQQGGDSAAKAEAFKALHEARLRHYEQFKEFDASKDEKDTVEDAEEKGVIDGGTWEHRKRAKEMLATAEAALSSSEQNKFGAERQHISKYLPKEIQDELNRKFFETLKKTRAVGAAAPAPSAAPAVVGNGLGAESDPAAPAADDDLFAQYRKRCQTAYRHRPNPLNNPRRNYY